MGEVLEVGATADGRRLGSYDDVVVTEDWNPLEPEVIEEKSYAPASASSSRSRWPAATARSSSSSSRPAG